MAKVSHVTSSGFVFERQESRVIVHCRRPLVPLAELEYLREVGPHGGRIADLQRASGDGRELHLVTVELPGGGAQVVTFDAGPAFLGHLRSVTDGLMFVVYGLAGATAIGTLGYMIARLISP